MTWRVRILIAAVLLLGSSIASSAQQSACIVNGNPLAYGVVPTAAQWNACFQAKQDALGYTAVNKAGDAMAGSLSLTASTIFRAGLIIAPGVAPSAPANGSVWITASGIFVQINGSTVQLTTGAVSVAPGTLGNLAYYSGASALSGAAALNYSAGALTAGTAGSLVGQFCMANATSGTICLNPSTGALGSSVVTAPIGTYTLAGLSLGQTFSGNNTFSGQLIETGTSAPASAAGQTAHLGTLAAAPTLTNTGQGFVFNTAGNGLNLQGDGTGNDLVLLNKNGTGVCSVLTGTQTINCVTLTLNNALSPANGGTGLTSLGTGVATALGINVGSAGAFVTNGGALGTPSSGVGTNLTALNASNVTTGNLPDAQMPNTTWPAFTPAFTCGSASITSNSATAKTWGKVTRIQIEFTFTALGSCTSTMTFSLPNTAQSAGALVGRETVASGKAFTCSFGAGATTATCIFADVSNFAGNSHGFASGVYANQ